MPTFSFPDCSFADWDTLYTLLKESFDPLEARIDPPSSMTRLTPELLREKAGYELLLTCMHEEQLVATAFVKPNDNWGYIGKVAVSKGYRRQGISRRIFEIIEKHGRAAGWDYLELQVRVELTENQSTFGSFGFVKTAETAHEGYDRPTSFTMQKRLN